MSSFSTATPFVPERLTLETLREAAEDCKGCDLYRMATQTVFGEGAVPARLMLVGETPGDQEDRAGRPFVGPAGRLLDESLAAAGLDRSTVYVTNAVKHFRFEERGKRRLHKKPSAGQVQACKPWLLAEIDVVAPELIVCLGATAAQSLMGGAFRITKLRGQVLPRNGGAEILATYHPSAVLRAPLPSDRDRMKRELIQDLKVARRFLCDHEVSL
jgi:uracil-DNA glycosylase family protein